ncbi:MAG: sigma-70 family RNA polymerase sigma factor [Pirellulales bacterium]
MTDAELLCAARRGNAEAWRTLYQRYLPSVWRQAYALVDDVHTAEDVTSETMIALLKGIDRLETDVPKIAGWLRAVVRCKVADHHRKNFRVRDKLPLAASASDACTGDANPAEPMEVEETRAQVLHVLDGLSDRQRTVLEWKYLDALRVREIADRLGETEKAVETVLYRARREFRRLFESEESCHRRARLPREISLPLKASPDIPQES